MRAPRASRGLFHRIARWFIEGETSGKRALSLFLADLLLAPTLIYLVNGYWLRLNLDPESYALLTGGLMGFPLVCCTYLPANRWPALWSTLKIASGAAFAIAIFPLAFEYLSLPLDRTAWARVVLPFAGMQWVLQAAHRRVRTRLPLEPLRWALLVTLAVVVAFPFATLNPVGTGDAYWYSNIVADFCTQWRHGVFPVFVGQSDYAFNGGVSPLRFAPYLQHAGGIIDLLTGHSLTFIGVLNLTLLLSLLAGAISTYSVLVAMDQRHRWRALAMSLLFLAAPAVLTMAYSLDLFMSLCTLPFLPIAMYAVWLSWTRATARSLCLLGAAVAASWICHPPIGFWTGVVAAVAQALRLLDPVQRNRQLWQGWLIALGTFIALTAYTFLSVQSLKLPPLIVEPSLIVAGLFDCFPGIFLPVSVETLGMASLQLDWSLWLFILVAVYSARFSPRRSVFFALFAGFGLLFLLLLPLPGISRLLWIHLIPQTISNLTFQWPMQRFYVIMSILASILGYLGLGALTDRRPRLKIAVTVTLLTALVWTGAQSLPLFERAHQNTANENTRVVTRLPQNRLMTRYAYSPFPTVPAYFSHGYIDPLWVNRLLDETNRAEITSNRKVIDGEAGRVRVKGDIEPFHYSSVSPFYRLIEALPIEPNRHYSLELTIAATDLAGSILATSPSIQREYYLPDSGSGMPYLHPNTAFGTLPNSSHSFPLFHSAQAAEPLLLQYVARGPSERELKGFGHYVLREYDPAELPIFVQNWTPYRAVVKSPAPAWVETPRMFVEGYRAEVNGQPVPVQRSPDNLVMFHVPAGESRAKLSYPGPTWLRLAYFEWLAAWGAVIVLALAAIARSWRTAS